MQEPVKPNNEALRIIALRKLKVLDTEPEARFDRITRLAQQLFNVPIALVSLVDTNRQWFKSCQGLGVKETPRNISFCGHAILGTDIFYLPNVLEDPRFIDNPLVTGEPNIRFYAGAPLSTKDGHRIGTLCIIDQQPRTFSPREMVGLRDLADCVEEALVEVDLRSLARLLQHEKTRMKALVDNIIDGIITIDEEGRVLSGNRAAERIFGYASEEMIGNNVKMLMPSPYRIEHDSYLHNYLETGQAQVIGIGREVEGLRKDGSVFPLDLAVSEIEHEGERIFTGIVRDITERKAAQEALIEAKQAAENANRQKSAFLNVMSHELRTPLTVILGYLPMLKNREQLLSTDTIVQIAEDMDISGQHLLALINDLLDISKIEAGEMALHPEKIRVSLLLQEMTRKFENQASIKDLKLLSESDDFLIVADPRRLRQILINLIGNALKFTPQGEIKISAERRNNEVLFEVNDTGIGIPEAELPHIFETFRQVDNTSTRVAGGSGLGLAITQRLVELHGGVIQVESRQGKGSRFTFSIKQ